MSSLVKQLNDFFGNSQNKVTGLLVYNTNQHPYGFMTSSRNAGAIATMVFLIRKCFVCMVCQ